MSAPTQAFLVPGPSRVALAAVAAGGGALRPRDAQEVPLAAPAPTTEAEWLESLPAAFAGLRPPPRRTPLTLLLPAFVLQHRLLQVPRVQPKKQAATLRHEASQALGVNEEEWCFGFRVLAGDAIEWGVLLCAVRRETLMAATDAARRAGLAVDSVGSTPVARAAAVQALYPGEEVALVELDPRTTTFALVGTAPLYLRVLPTGDPGAPAPPESVDAVAPVLTRELTRTLASAESAGKRPPPTRLLLHGEEETVRQLTPLLAGYRSLPTERLPVEQLWEGGLLPDLGDPGTVLAISGQATRDGDGLPRTGLELLPEPVRRRQRFRRERPLWIAAALLLASLPLPFLLQARERAAAHREAAALLGERWAERRALADSIDSLLAERDDLRARIRQTEGIVRGRAHWILFFADLQEALHTLGDAWIDELAVEPAPAGSEAPYELRMEGRLLLREPGTRQAVEESAEVLTGELRALADRFLATPFLAERRVLRPDFRLLQEGKPVLAFELVFSLSPDHPLYGDFRAETAP